MVTHGGIKWRREWQWIMLALIFSSLRFTNVDAVKGGYYLGGSSYLLPASGIDASLFTHLFYAFSHVNQDDATVTVPDSETEAQSFSASMKSINPEVLTLLSISAPASEFLVVLESASSRAAFIDSSISLAREYSFDGLDLDWEYPQSQAQMDDFATLLAEWHDAVVVECENSSLPQLLLTAAVYFTSTILFDGAGSYPISAITDSLDFVNVMAYDFHSGTDPRTGANANLYDPNNVVNGDHGITTWLDAGLASKQLVLGLTMYGPSWTLADQNADAGLNAPAVGPGPPQPVSQDAGLFYFSEVADWIDKGSVTVVHDTELGTGWCYANNVWVSYEDTQTISLKVEYAKGRDLGGYFFWMVSYDRNWEISRAASQTLDS